MSTQVPVASGHVLGTHLLFIMFLKWNLALYLEQPAQSRGNDCCLPTRRLLASSTTQNNFGRPKKCRKAELKDFRGRFSPPRSGFLMCNRCWHIFVQLLFLVLEGTKCVGCRALFYAPMLLLFADVTVDRGWCLRIPSGSDVDFRITDKPFFGQRLLLLSQFKWGSSFVLLNHCCFLWVNHRQGPTVWDVSAES